MKILFLTHRIPYPPNKGEKIRAYHELEYLGARHTVDLFCLADSAVEAKGAQALKKLCRSVHVEIRSSASALLAVARNFWKREPLSPAFFFSARLQAAIDRALVTEQYDMIFIYCSSMAQYVRQTTSVPVVIDFVDTDSAKWAQYAQIAGFPLSWLYRREARCLADYEKELAGASAASIVATLQEAMLLDGEGHFPVQVIGNGVCLPPASADAKLSAEIARLRPFVLFIGTMDYLPNVDAVEYFAEEIWPRVHRRHPAVRFVIAGRNPTRRVRELAKRPGIVVTGDVPEVRPYLAGATAVVAPFRICQGVQNKILEALAAGVPVVSTPRPAQAIGARDGETLLIASTTEEFVRAVNSLLEDPELRLRFSGTPEFVREHFDWQKNLERLEQLLEHLAIVPRKFAIGARNRAEAR